MAAVKSDTHGTTASFFSLNTVKGGKLGK